MSDLKSEGERVFMEAIELGIRGRSPYPERAMFLDADEPGLAKAIAQAGDEGLAVVLCYADGTRRIVDVRVPADAM
jgi:DNA topoisomerase IA